MKIAVMAGRVGERFIVELSIGLPSLQAAQASRRVQTG
ncbi:hypothetical protein JOD24_000639 [Kroppenstedtia sanguinis]